MLINSILRSSSTGMAAVTKMDYPFMANYWWVTAVCGFAMVISISLIPTYLPIQTADNGPSMVPMPNFTSVFAMILSSDDLASLNGLNIINLHDIAKQLTSVFRLRIKAIRVSSATIQSFPPNHTKIQGRYIIGCEQIVRKNAIMVMETEINYSLCGKANTCMVQLYNRVIRALETYQDGPFAIHLEFNRSIQVTVLMTPCRWKSGLCLSGKFPDLYEATIADLQQGLQAGHFTSVDLVKAYMARIHEVNRQGPTLRAVMEVSSTALDAASIADQLRRQGQVLSFLHGIPILLKDNIATRAEDGMNTTAGSYALLGSIPPDDATVVKKLRAAGAIILGKTTLSEWANFRGMNIPHGWSGLGGQATSPFYPGGDACGSSTGSGIAAAIGLAAATLGTETDGSIICPSARNNLVGIKPTVGLTSRKLVIPLSHTQDSVGPMCRSVADAAAVLSIIAGRDATDNHTQFQPERVPDYSQHLKKDALRGARIGVLRQVFANATLSQYPDYIISEFNRTIEQTFKRLGAIIIDPADLATADEIATNVNELIVVSFDFKYGINQYLSELKRVPSGVRTLEDLIRYNHDHPELELPLGRDKQDLFLLAQNTTHFQDPVYINATRINRDLSMVRGLDQTLKSYNLDALIAPAESYTPTPAAIAGYPIITVPLGFLPNDIETKNNAQTSNQNLPIWPAPNFPFGLAFIGAPYTESRLIELAYSYEQATRVRSHGKPFEAAIPATQLFDILC